MCKFINGLCNRNGISCEFVGDEDCCRMYFKLTDKRNDNTIEVVVDKYDWFRDTSVVKQIFVRRVNQLINRRGEC